MVAVESEAFTFLITGTAPFKWGWSNIAEGLSIQIWIDEVRYGFGSVAKGRMGYKQVAWPRMGKGWDGMR